MAVKHHRLKIGIWLLVAVSAWWWLAGCSGSRMQAAPQPPAEVTLLFFNDLHGHLQPFDVQIGQAKRSVGGIARLATLIRRIEARNDLKKIPTLILVAGDILQGTPVSTVFRGEAEVACLNAMGVDAVTVGNHEFDFGFDNFLKLRRLAEFPFLSANIIERETGKRLSPPALSVPLANGRSLTVIGITTEDFLTTTLAAHVAGLEVADAVETVRTLHAESGSQGPVVVLSHSRHRTDRAVAAAVPQLAAIIGGHDQILMRPPRTVASVPIFQAFEKGRFLGRIDLQVDAAGPKARVVHSAYIPVTADIPLDPQISAIVDAYSGRLGREFQNVIGYSRSVLNGKREHVRYQETNLGDFIADIMAARSGSQIALLNSGAVRASILQGPVTMEDVVRAMPFSIEIVVLRLTGADIQAALNRSVRGVRADEDGGFLQVAGLAFEIRARRAVDIRVGPERRPLAADATYTVAVTDFLASGGDGYHMLTGKPQVKTGLPLREVIIDTINRRKTVSVHTDGRIRRDE